MRLTRTVLIFFLLLGSNALCQGVVFSREDITFRLSSKHFIVDGYYWFYNLTAHEVNMSIYYPFPATGNAGTVDSVDIFDIAQESQPKFLGRTETGFSFILTIAGHDTTLYHIAYRQKVAGDSATYILRSTHAWNRPLDYAEYKLMIEDSIRVFKFSYDPDTLYDIGGKRIYLWRRTNFMPERDFVIHFKPE
ncbi:MAG TPA: hypothetical protein VLX91_14795 [Candidatus Acidoferrales bacterium]|nr:hypothetical protein [Candidatus Acidoferrales bacterium]